jgi:ribonuclease BN (tRNA processing enzyme)
VDALVPAAKDADLFIAEAFFREKKMKFHLNFETLMQHMDDIAPKHLVLTHMSPDMLEAMPDFPEGLRITAAEDGMEIAV